MSTEESILTAEGVRLGLVATDKADAIEQCGRLLAELGSVDEPYLRAMHEREHEVPTYVGEGVAIPHGTNESRRHIRRDSLVVLQFPDGVDWDGKQVQLCVGIAVDGNSHVAVLSALATVLLDAEDARQLRDAAEVDTVLRLLGSMNSSTAHREVN